MSLDGKTSYLIWPVALVALFLSASSARAQAVAPGVAALIIQQPDSTQRDRTGDQNQSEVEQLKKTVEQHLLSISSMSESSDIKTRCDLPNLATGISSLC
jgi:hypothetical protein